MKGSTNAVLTAVLCILSVCGPSAAFAPPRAALSRGVAATTLAPIQVKTLSPSSTSLSASDNEDFGSLSESDQTILGAVGTLAALIVFYSEFTLKTTGCGLPAGPFGIFGLAEGLSYLGVTGLVAYSAVTKVKTVSETTVL